MNSYIKTSNTAIYEIGCGTGVSKEFIKNDNLKLTDVLSNEWVDLQMDAMNLTMEDNSVDVFIVCNALHHFAYPAKFLKQAQKKLKVGGRILIYEPYTSLAIKLPMWLCKLEGWNDDADVFSEVIPCNNPNRAWSANLSIPRLMFFDSADFEKNIPGLHIVEKSLKECLMFLNSGGVNFKTFHIPLSDRGCRILEKIDALLVRLMPGAFAMGCKVVIEKDND